jgi:hypothetical protein
MGILYGLFWQYSVNFLIIFVFISMSWAYSLFMLPSYFYSSLKQTRACLKQLRPCQLTLGMQDILFYKFPDNVAHFAISFTLYVQAQPSAAHSVSQFFLFLTFNV